ncbi:MAG: L-aspartate oxidase [Puniceicoccales bacterium]|jgi:L-aspartate oxidase|nr:L-aspartate oxidase [Puniceicoccales bacterium]
MSKTTDVIVVGSGIAGLSFALKLAAKGWQVTLITKKKSAESNTNNAQGGIACVMDSADNFEAHVRDTLEAGDGLCDEAVTRAIVEAAPERIRELAEAGVAFSQGDSGNFDLGREGGHSHRRILHVKDLTGAAIEEALLGAVARDPRIHVHEHFLAIDIITRAHISGAGAGAVAAHGNTVLGLYALDTQQGAVVTLRAPVVVLATGGVGQVYQYTTNPGIATGDGIAMAYRAGVPVSNMEFVQFHPTALYNHNGDRSLISEAVRGEGAILRDLNERAFMPDYHALADLAPRDIVARAIDNEMKKSGAPHVWLDIRGRGEDALRKRFPHIFDTCQRNGINMARDLIPVVPAAHYLCGGVRTNLRAETALTGLYACGEVACTGLHGANRLASNSLLEAVVLAHNGTDSADAFLRSRRPDEMPVPDWVNGDVTDSDERVVLTHNWDELRRTMWDYVGIVRTTKRLHRARTRIRALEHEIAEYYWNFKVEPPLLELRNLTQVASLSVECALLRKESRGLHFTLDFPKKSPELRDSTVRRAEALSAHGVDGTDGAIA